MMGQPRPRGQRCAIKSWGGKLLLLLSWSSSLLSLMRAPPEAVGSDQRMVDPFCKHFSCLCIYLDFETLFLFPPLSLYGALTSSLFPLLLLSLLRSHSPLQSGPPPSPPLTPSNFPVHQKRNTVQRDFNTRMDRQLLRSIFSLFSPATMITILTMDSRIEPLLSFFLLHTWDYFGQREHIVVRMWELLSAAGDILKQKHSRFPFPFEKKATPPRLLSSSFHSERPPACTRPTAKGGREEDKPPS